MKGFHRHAWLALFVCTTALLLIGTTKTVLAHANDRLLQQESVSAGLYQLTIWTAPARLRTGEIHVETMVFDMAGNPDRKCAVYVALTPLDPTLPAVKSLSVPVPPNLVGGMEGMRQAVFKVDQPGRYQVETIVVDGTGAGGRTVFEVEIIRVPLLFHLFIYLLLGLTLLACVWMLRKGADVWFGRASDETFLGRVEQSSG